MQFDFNGKGYQWKYWEPVLGSIGNELAFDTETTLIVTGEIPKFVIGQAYAGGDCVFLIRLDQLKDFFETHKDSIIIMHNAPFDISVVEQEIDFDFDSMIRNQGLFDIGILTRLLRLATDGAPGKWALDVLANEILGVALEKDIKIRCSFGKYRRGDRIDYSDMQFDELKYAAIDPVVTWEIFKSIFPSIVELSPQHFLSHKIKLMGAVGHDAVSHNGIGFDLERRNVALDVVEKILKKVVSDLAEFGYIPGASGVKKVHGDLIKGLGISVKKTKKGNPSYTAENLEPFRDQHPYIDSYLKYMETKKHVDFLNALSQSRIHTHFNTLLVTGRTSSYDPCLQNISKGLGIREMFIPSPGCVFVIIDYKQAELCTLAQICIDLYGYSKMGELINQGVDLHRWFASIITGKSESEITPEVRDWAKACNFGFPGGLGIEIFLAYAKQTFGIQNLTENQAKEFKRKWLDAFPEMKNYLREPLLNRYDFSTLPGCDNPEIACGLFKRIIRGEAFSTQGNLYPQGYLDWAFKKVLPELVPELEGVRSGSDEILEMVSQETVFTRTGRIRAKADYCAARNTPFQGLAADGMNIALYRLKHHGYRVVNVIHDEFVVEIPMNSDPVIVGKEIETIVVAGMKSVVPGVKITGEWFVSDCWCKKPDLVERSGVYFKKSCLEKFEGLK